MHWAKVTAFAAIATVASACMTAGGQPTTSATGEPSSAARSAQPSASAANPIDCPITIPVGTFVPPLPWPPQPPALYRAVWYGTNDLWTMLSPTGEIWRGLPSSGQTLGQKTFWFSTNYRDPAADSSPAINVEGRRLDGSGERFTAGDPGTNASADFGLSMLVGVDIPGPGCWELQATYQDASLAYVVWIRGS
jgi:hypothetical protein